MEPESCSQGSQCRNCVKPSAAKLQSSEMTRRALQTFVIRCKDGVFFERAIASVQAGTKLMFTRNDCCVVSGHSIVMSLGSFKDSPVWPLINFNKEEVFTPILAPGLHKDWGFLDTAPGLTSGIFKSKEHRVTHCLPAEASSCKANFSVEAVRVHQKVTKLILNSP